MQYIPVSSTAWQEYIQWIAKLKTLKLLFVVRVVANFFLYVGDFWFSEIKVSFGFKFLKFHAQIPVSSTTWQDYLEYRYKYPCKLLTDKSIKTINNKYPCQVVLEQRAAAPWTALK